jgi:signal transduction histidine kinase
MAGGLAHDFRNLLAAISSDLRLAERSLDQPEKVQAYINAMQEAVDRGVELTSQLLAFARHQELDVHERDVNEFLRSFEQLLRYGAGPNTRIRLNLGSGLPPCRVDPASFDAAVLNLVANARDAMPKGGEIEITTEQVLHRSLSGLAGQTYVCVRVTDQGTGMPPHVLRKACDLFFTTKGEKGTGLGLAQVHAFVREAGGEIIIKSELGAGTTVELLLPALGTVDGPA